jgi:hypothetical protein
MNSRTYQTSDFPLRPVVALGQALAVGDLAKVIGIPDVMFHGFDEIARARYTAMMHRVLPIAEFDANGYAIFALFYQTPADLLGSTEEPAGLDCFETHDFCFDPRDLERVPATLGPASSRV